MRRKAIIILGVVVLAWGVLALALGSPSLKLSSGSSSNSGAPSTASVSGASPQCLPTNLEHNATLAGTNVAVSPAPETDSANPKTQISFLGAPAAEIRSVTVAGSVSGTHSGQLRNYSQGDGASFAPSKPFSDGERVNVSAVVGSGAGKHIAFHFNVDTPYPTAGVGEFHNPTPAPADYQSFYTLPSVQAPVMTVTTPDRDPGAGDIFTTNGPGPGQYGPLIYSPSGRLVWFEELSGGLTAEDLNEQSYEGQPVLTWWRGRVLSLGFGQGEDIVMNSKYQTIAKVAGGNGLKADLHEFQIAPDNVAYVTAYNPVRCDLSSVEEGSKGGAIVDAAVQEIDMKTGLVRWEWHSLDHIAASESEVATPSSSRPWDYFHLNSIDPQADGRILISARSTWAAYQLDGHSGKILWRLGGNKSSFRMGPGTKTAWQHDGRILPNGEITLFDDGSNPPVHSQSRAIRIRIDLSAHTATLSANYTHREAPLLAASQGNAQTLPDGNVLVGYGGVPAITEYASDGSLLFDAHQPYDESFYRAYRRPWSGQPLTPPVTLPTLNNTSEETIVHASWNGATDVASWRVLAGAHEGSLAALATMPDSGFESSTSLPKRYAYVSVQALDASGRVLGTSKTTKVITYSASLPGSGH